MRPKADDLVYDGIEWFWLCVDRLAKAIISAGSRNLVPHLSRIRCPLVLLARAELGKSPRVSDVNSLLFQFVVSPKGQSGGQLCREVDDLWRGSTGYISCCLTLQRGRESFLLGKLQKVTKPIEIPLYARSDITGRDRP